MTYSAIMPPLGAWQSVTQEKCDGPEVVTQFDKPVCCPSKTFSNSVYKSKKGEASWRYQNEGKVRHMLSLLLDPHPRGDRGIDVYAYDSQAGRVNPALLVGLMVARGQYNKKVPAGRWSTNKKGRASSCQSDGYYTTFVEGSPKSSSAFRTVINSVPGSEGHRNNRVRPTMDEYVRLQNGEVVGAPWVDDFLDVFVPGWRTGKAVGPSFRPTKVTLPGGFKTGRPFVQDQRVSAGLSRNTKMALGIGAVGLVVAGVFAMGRKR